MSHYAATRFPLRIRRVVGTAVCTVWLAGCAVGPDFVTSQNGLDAVQLAPRPDYPGSVQGLSDDVPIQWWSLFDDRLLTELEMKAYSGNLGLQEAAGRIEESRAQLGITSSELLPTVGANTSYAREAISKFGHFGHLGAPTSPNNFWQLGFDANWEIDLWGRARRASEGRAAELEGTVYDHEAVRVALAAEVARTYLQLRGTQAQIDIAEQNRVIAERALGLAESRARNGVATRFESASARAELATIKAMLPDLAQRRNALMNALALLLGEKPRALDLQLFKAMPLPSLPTNVPVGVPSELARRRPDILRAEAQLHAATAAIGVAKADFYPRISLTGQMGIEAFNLTDLSSWDSRFFSFGPAVYLPIFQGGRLMRQLELNEARQKTAAIAYRQTVLQAWHEIDNSLDAWAAQQREYAELIVAVDQSKQALQVAERGYQEGAVDYLSVLTAQRNLLASQTSLNASATNATIALVNLYKSLGGGWDPREPMAVPSATVNTPAVAIPESVTVLSSSSIEMESHK